MKRIAVVAANGKAGRLIVEEALRRGLDVTAIVRGENRTATSKVIAKDAMELTAQDLGDFDAVVSAVGRLDRRYGARRGRRGRTPV